MLTWAFQVGFLSSKLAAELPAAPVSMSCASMISTGKGRKQLILSNAKNTAAYFLTEKKDVQNNGESACISETQHGLKNVKYNFPFI